MNEIAVFTPIHRRPDLILDQIRNYEFFHRNNAFHLLHPSSEGLTDLGKLMDLLKKVDCDVYVNPISQGTSWKCVFGAFVSNTNFLLTKNDLKPEYIYLHTDADLIIKGSLSRYVFDNEIGFTSNKLTHDWVWSDRLFQDERFSKLKKYLSISDEEIFLGRMEGSFFPYKLWAEIMSLITKFYDDGFFSEPKAHWPLEEVLIQTIIQKLYPNLKHAPIVVITRQMKDYKSINPRDIDDNCIQIEDVQEAIKNNLRDCIGMKWFSQNYDDPARQLVRNLVCQAAS